MADAYYLIGVYDRAVQCYRECIREFEKAGDDSIYSRINFRKMLSEYGCCLLHLDMEQEAMEVYRKLEETGKSEEIVRGTRLAANVFFTYLAESEGHREKAADHVRQAVMALEDMRQVSSEYDSIQNLLQYVEKTGNIELLQEILDCLEPKAAIEQNRSLLLQLLLLRLRYCSAQMSIEEFRQATETFFHIKESSEMIESNQVMYMLELRKRLQAVEEEQREQTKKRNKLLYQSEHDELTGLYNKRSLNRYLEDVFEDCKLNEKELGILFLDIDYFKQLNDRYGHGKGDEGICAVADTLKRIFPEDYVARYGGDEFLVVMPERDLAYAMEHAELLCAGIREYKIPNEDRSKYKGISCRTCNESGKTNGCPLPSERFDCSDLDLRLKYKIDGEMWGMTKLEIIRANPYPCVSGLHFYPENIYWDNIGRKYITRFIDTPLRYYINDQENSLTGNAYSAHRETIFVRLHFINECWDYAKSNPKFFIKQFVGLSRDGLLNGKRFSEIKKMPDTFSKRALAVIFYPMGYFLYKKQSGGSR